MTTSSPFNAKSTALEVIHGIDLAGKHAIVTGGASGLGFETARALASAGARVTLAVRLHGQGEQARDKLLAEFPLAKVKIAHVDLNDRVSINAFAAEWLRSRRPLDILINNAGIMACPFAKTAEGWEAQFATNHFGHFFLGQALMPSVLEAGQLSGDARVICLSSSGHKISPVMFDDIHFEQRDYNKWKAYGQSKSANALYSLGLNQRHAAQGVTANAVHPGGIMTGLQKHLDLEEQRALGWLKADDTPIDMFKNLEQGAATAVWAATSPLLAKRGGLYLEDCQVGIAQPKENRVSGYSDHIMDAAAADRLWDLSLKAMI
jgi:NAD(P)-dependent dehydrogenase (short-subunit alcohol dehydrogenase family)